MDTVIINPNPNEPMGELRAVEPPVWAAMYACLLEKKSTSVAIVDAEALELSVEETVAQARAYKPKGIVIVTMGKNPSNSSTPKMPAAIELSQQLREGDYRTYITGLHPLCLPELTKQETGLEVLPLSFESMGNSAWHLLPMESYRAHNWHCLQDINNRGEYASIYTSFGCPFNCSYCNIPNFYGSKQIHYRTPEDILSEIDTLVNQYGVKNLKFCDELFTLQEDRVATICELLKERRCNLNIWAYARVDTVNAYTLEVMKKAGINWLAYGFESADSSTRSSVGKKYSLEAMEHAIKLTKMAGINTMGNFMFGLPSDTLETMRESLDWAKEMLFEFINFYVAMPYPGSRWFTELHKAGEASLDWARYSQYAKNPVGRRDAIEFRDKAFKEYFNNPAYLSMVRSKFGLKAESHIKEMLGKEIRK